MPNIKIFDGTVPRGECTGGCLPHVPGVCAELPRLGDEWLLPQAEIDDLLLDIKDTVLDRIERMRSIQIFQGQQSSCCPSANGNAAQQINLDEGEDDPPIQLSQASSYAWDGFKSTAEPPYTVADLIPRRSDNGMTMRTGILLASHIGIAPASVIDPMDWRRQNWPSEDIWLWAARQHRVLEWREVLSLRRLDSALARALPVPHGYAGHARCIVWKDPKTKTYYAINSWVSEPMHYLSEAQVREGQDRYGAYCAITSTAA